MAKYIQCDNCGDKIMFGDFIYEYDSCYAYCSSRCFAENFAAYRQLNLQLAKELDAEIFDTEDTRKREILEQIAALQKELESITTQN